MVQLSHLYTTTGKTVALTRWTFVGKVMSLLFNMLSRFITAFFFFAKGRKFCFIPFFEPSCSCWQLEMAPCLHGHCFLLVWDMGPARKAAVHAVAEQLHFHFLCIGQGNGNPLHQGWGSLVGCCLWGLTESNTTEMT